MRHSMRKRNKYQNIEKKWKKKQSFHDITIQSHACTVTIASDHHSWGGRILQAAKSGENTLLDV